MSEMRLIRRESGEHELIEEETWCYIATIYRSGSRWKIRDDGGLMTQETFSSLTKAERWVRKDYEDAQW